MEERKVQRSGKVYNMYVATSRPAKPAVPAFDPLGIPLPEARTNVFAARSDFREAQELFDHLAVLLDRIAKGVAGELYRQEMVRSLTDGQAGWACPLLRLARQKLLAAEPYCAYCPRSRRAYP